MDSAIHSEMGFRAADGALVRAVVHGELDLPQLPDAAGTGPTAVAAWVAWLRQVWAIGCVSDALSLASPQLAERVRALCAAEVPDERETRRAVLSVLRYLARMVGRPTPNGLFAGIVPAGSAGGSPWVAS